MLDSRSSSLSELARLGFEALSETVPKLEQLVKLVGDRGHAALAAISSSSSPDRALDALIRLAEIDSKTLSKVISKHEQAQRLCRVLAASNGLADFLLRHPHLISVFTSPSRIPGATELSSPVLFCPQFCHCAPHQARSGDTLPVCLPLLLMS